MMKLLVVFNFSPSSLSFAFIIFLYVASIVFYVAGLFDLNRKKLNKQIEMPTITIRTNNNKKNCNNNNSGNENTHLSFKFPNSGHVSFASNTTFTANRNNNCNDDNTTHKTLATNETSTETTTLLTPAGSNLIVCRTDKNTTNNEGPLFNNSEYSSPLMANKMERASAFAPKTKPAIVSGSSVHYSTSENNYTNPSSISASIGNNPDTLWHFKMSEAVEQQHHLQHPAAQICIERAPSAFSSCGGSDSLTQYVVDYVGYPMLPPPHITSAAISGSQQSFPNGSHNTSSITASTSDSTTISSINSSNSSQRYENKYSESSSSQQHQPKHSSQRYGTLKKPKHYTSSAAVTIKTDQQLVDIIKEVQN